MNDDTDQDKTEYLDDYLIEEVTDSTFDDDIATGGNFSKSDQDY